MITSEHWVFVLEAGGSWKRITFDHQQPHHCPKNSHGSVHQRSCILLGYRFRSQI
ncbi:hypothetical protein AtEden1_Chr5g0110831 [Arabidopsis thaliana]